MSENNNNTQKKGPNIQKWVVQALGLGVTALKKAQEQIQEEGSAFNQAKRTIMSLINVYASKIKAKAKAKKGSASAKTNAANAEESPVKPAEKTTEAKSSAQAADMKVAEEAAEVAEPPKEK